MQFEQVWESVFQAISDIVLVMGVEEGPIFRYLHANPAALQLNAILPVNLGKTINEVHSSNYASILNTYYKEVLNTGEPLSFTDIPDTLHQVTSCVTATPLFHEGRCTHLVVVARNLSEQLIAERNRIEAEQRYQSLLQHNPDAIFHCDTSGIITHINPATKLITGYSDEELLYHSVFEFVPQTEQNTYTQGFHEALRERSATFDTYLNTREGNVVYASVKLVPSITNGKMSGVFGIVKDVTDEKNLQFKLAASEQQYRLMTEHVTDLISMSDPSGAVQYLSPSYQRMLGIDPKGYLGQPGPVSVHPDDQEKVLEHFKTAKSTRQPITVRHRKFRITTGDYLSVDTTFVPIVDGSGCVSQILVVAHDVSRYIETERKLQTMAFTDVLTHLPNRRYYGEQIEGVLQTGASHAVLFLDCDNFKSINDTYGHQAGDAFLIEIAKRIQRCTRTGDIVARFAGDEFCVLLKDTAAAEAAEVAQRIIQTIQQPIKIEGATLRTTTSIGISFYPKDATAADELIDNADQAMYEAKKTGKNQYKFFSDLA